MSRVVRWILRGVVVILALGVLTALAGVLGLMMALKLPETRLAPDLVVLEDRGGNSTLLITDEGLLLVDTKFWKFSESLKKQIDKLSDKPMKYVINTHHHWDHTQGNHLFPVEATYVATEHSLSWFARAAPDYWAQPGRQDHLAKQGISERDHHIRLGGQLIHVVQVGTGHTGGDCVVYFPGQRTVATGDLFFNGYYPVIDREAGGSFGAWIETLDRVLALGPARIVPGHGPVTEPAELKAFQGYLRDLLTGVAALREKGLSREQVMAQLKLPVHEERLKSLWTPWFETSLASNAGDAFDELEAGGKVPERPTGGVEAVEGEPGGEEGGEEAAPAAPAETP